MIYKYNKNNKSIKLKENYRFGQIYLTNTQLWYFYLNRFNSLIIRDEVIISYFCKFMDFYSEYLKLKYKMYWINV